MKKLHLQSTISLKDDCFSQTSIVGEEAILSLRDAIYYGLNSVATEIWHTIDERGKLDEIGICYTFDTRSGRVD